MIFLQIILYEALVRLWNTPDRVFLVGGDQELVWTVRVLLVWMQSETGWRMPEW